MLIRNFLTRPAGAALAVGLALLLSAVAPQARAQPSLSPPVQEVRDALLDPIPPTDVPEQLTKSLQERASKLKRLTDDSSKLQSLGDISQALLLPNWAPSSATSSSETAKVDHDAYKALVDRFLGRLRAEIKAADRSPEVRAAVVTLAGEFGATARSGQTSLRGNPLLLEDLGRFSEVVADVARNDKTPEPRAAAAGALAKLQSDPVKDKVIQQVTVPALESMLNLQKSPDVRVRRAAALALRDLLRGTKSADRGGYVASPEVAPSGLNLKQFGPQVAKAAGGVLSGKEPDADVRRLAADALVEVAGTLKAKLRPAGPTEKLHEEMQPVVEALWAQTSAIDRAARDEDTRVQHSALRALEQMGDVRLYWMAPGIEPLRTAPLPEKPKGGSVKPSPLTLETPPEGTSDLMLTYAVAQAQPVRPPNEPVPLAAAVPTLVASLRDERVRNRLAAIDAIETITARASDQRTLAQDLGAKPAAEVARAVTRALGDPDRFVRWASARTLGEMAPLHDVENGESVERGAVAGLVRLLFDADPDVRMRAAIALERFGKAARDAVPALSKAVVNRNDLEARISAADAILVIGGHAAEAVPALADNLTDPNVRMRRKAAEALASFGPDAAPAKAALNRALFDSDPEVRRLASEAIIKIGPRK
jgi:HEAT repeat protein